MIQRRFRSRERRAVAAVEMAFVLPPILFLLLGIWEVGRMVEIQQLLTNAAREGGRHASIAQYNSPSMGQVSITNANVQTVVLNYLQQAGLSTTGVTVTVSDLTNPGTDVSQASYLDNIQITVTMPYSNVRWTVLSLVTNPSTQITGQVQWMSMIDQSYPQNTPQPPQG